MSPQTQEPNTQKAWGLKSPMTMLNTELWAQFPVQMLKVLLGLE